MSTHPPAAIPVLCMEAPADLEAEEATLRRTLDAQDAARESRRNAAAERRARRRMDAPVNAYERRKAQQGEQQEARRLAAEECRARGRWDR